MVELATLAFAIAVPFHTPAAIVPRIKKSRSIEVALTHKARRSGGGYGV